MQTKTSLRNVYMAIALVGITVFFALASPQFLGARNLSLLMTELAITATLALGMLLVILPGNIDLSAGSGVGLLGGIASVLVFEKHLPAPLAMLIALCAGLAIWGGMGALIVRERIPSFIITLGGLLVLKGVFWLVIHNATIPVVLGGQANLYSLITTYYLTAWQGYGVAIGISSVAGFLLFRGVRDKAAELSGEEREMRFLKFFVLVQSVFLFVVFTNQYRGVPVSALILAVVAMGVHVLTRHTRFGRYLYAIGGNEEAAVLSGVPVQKVVTRAFVLMGGIVTLTGLMQTAYAGASTTTVGELMELDAVAACVIGGVSLKGGRGGVVGVLFGALLMAMLLNGMTLLAVAPEFKFIVRGLVLALAVWGDVRMARNA